MHSKNFFLFFHHSLCPSNQKSLVELDFLNFLHFQNTLWLTWYKRNHLSNHLLLSAHLLYKNPANLESYLAFSANPNNCPSFMRIERCIRWTFGLSIIPDIWKIDRSKFNKGQHRIPLVWTIDSVATYWVTVLQTLSKISKETLIKKDPKTRKTLNLVKIDFSIF